MDRKGNILFSAKLNPSLTVPVGVGIFFNPDQGDQKMPVGSCFYSLEDTGEQVYAEIESVQAEIYQDTELFVNMTPFLTFDNKYCSSLGIGKEDLFWKMGLILMASSSITTTVRIGVQDRDLIFDDFIGQTALLIPPFDPKVQQTAEGN